MENINKQGIIAYELYNNVYLNITNRCTAECVFCRKRDSDILKSYNLHCSESIANVSVTAEPLMPLDEVTFGYNIRLSNEPVYGRDLHLSKEPNTEEVINELGDYDLSKYNEVVFTGLGEPMIRFNEVLEITKWLTRKGIQVRIDTIGHAKLLFPERNVAKELADSGMKKVSISLNAHDEETYNKICRPKLKNSYGSMFEFAHDIIKAGMGLRFTIVNLPDVDINKCRQIAWKYNATFEVRTLF